MLWRFPQWLANRLMREHGNRVMDYGIGTTICPNCGVKGTYKITMRQGGQVISCKNCHKNFTAQLDHGQFTGNNH